MLQAIFHAWERRLASVTKDRVVRPFEWGLDWIPAERPSTGCAGRGSRRRLGIERHGRHRRVLHARADDRLHPAPGAGWGCLLTFPSAFVTPHADEQHGLLPVLSAREASERRGRPVLVLPQWNSDAGGHVGLCRLLAWSGLSALRLSLPYHDQRMPPEMHRADYIVSANIARTVQVCRQAVLDARRAIAWLASQGYDRIGILGTSLGSCLVTADYGARAADSGAGAESHLAVLRRCRVARALDTPRARRAGRAHRARSSARRSGSRSARGGISSAFTTGRRCWSTRATT